MAACNTSPKCKGNMKGSGDNGYPRWRLYGVRGEGRCFNQRDPARPWRERDYPWLLALQQSCYWPPIYTPSIRIQARSRTHIHSKDDYMTLTIFQNYHNALSFSLQYPSLILLTLPRLCITHIYSFVRSCKLWWIITIWKR